MAELRQRKSFCRCLNFEILRSSRLRFTEWKPKKNHFECRDKIDRRKRDRANHRSIIGSLCDARGQSSSGRSDLYKKTVQDLSKVFALHEAVVANDHASPLGSNGQVVQELVESTNVFDAMELDAIYDTLVRAKDPRAAIGKVLIGAGSRSVGENRSPGVIRLPSPTKRRDCAYAADGQ